MLSLDNGYTEAHVRQFVQRCREKVGHEVTFALEPKIDGLSVSLVFQRGVLAQAVTRGDGLVGEVVTANVKTIQGLPLVLPDAQRLTRLEVRGEVYLSRGDFQRLNQDRQDKGLELFANARNAAAGSLRLLDTVEVARRHLSIFVFQGLCQNLDDLWDHRQWLFWLKNQGFPVSEHLFFSQNVEDLLAFLNQFGSKRHHLPFDTDGMVIKAIEPQVRTLLGATQKFPRWALAFKFPAEQVTTRLRGITVQVGRTGKLTPVGELDPVLLAGSQVSRVTLHNFEEIERKDIRVGDILLVEKGGDVIPKVVKVIMAKREEGVLPFVPPTICPQCGAPIDHSGEQTDLFCVNVGCPAQRLRRLSHFVSKKAMDIRGLGDEWLEALLSAGLISDFPSLFSLPNRLHRQKLKGMGPKWIANLERQLEEARSKPFVKVLYALGIPMVGERNADLLTQAFPDFSALIAASEEAIADIKGLGPAVALSLKQWCATPEFLAEIQSLADLGLQLHRKEQLSSDEALPLEGIKVVLTGSFLCGSRETLTARLRQLGAEVASSVSAKTDFLVAGDKAGSKMEKARALGIRIVGEEWAQQWLNK
jgi:DNA ligase (NAD+)